MLFANECGAVRDLLWDLAAGNLSKTDQERANLHLSACKNCSADLEEYRNAISLMGIYKSQAVPASLLSWRDFENRVATAPFGVRSVSNKLTGAFRFAPMLRLMAGGGILAVGALAIFIVIQNHNISAGLDDSNRPLLNVTKNPRVHFPVLDNFGSDIDSLAGTVDESIKLPGNDVADIPHVRSAQPQKLSLASARVSASASVSVRSTSSRRASAGRMSASSVQIATADVNVDGDTPRQVLRPDYVMASASSGNDYEQNRHYEIDVVSSSSGGSDASEETHPW